MPNTAQDNFATTGQPTPDAAAGSQAQAPAPPHRPPDPSAPLTVTWDDLNTRRVDSRLKEQEALTRNREYARMDESSLPQGTATKTTLVARIWRNSVFALALFGLVGGVVAWACGASVQFRATLEQDAKDRMAAIANVDQRKEEGSIPEDQAKSVIDELIASGRQQNPYFSVKTDPKYAEATPELLAEQNRILGEIAAQDKFKAFILNILAYGVSGVMIGLFLAIALPVTEKNLAATIINGSVGATLGLVGGVIVSLFVDKLYHAVAVAPNGHTDPTRQFLARIAVWGSLGLFLTIAPGLVMRNWKKFLIGLIGGMVGGLLGGVLYDPIVGYTHKTRPAELIAMAAIGLFAGMTTGLIENVAKSGWVRVVQGLIAGKQFILYRNPTFVGSGPDCQIYLFKDPKVGRRHAAIHIVPGGFELEDLPLGSPTLVNGNPVGRVKLKSGDRIQIGSTGLVFQEKAATK